MSESEQNENGTPECEAPWPENGGQWSDGEEGVGLEEGAGLEDSGLLQEMAEEDEDIDFYNEETFGMDLDTEDMGGDLTNPLLHFGKPSPAPPLPPVLPTPTAPPASPPLPPSTPLSPRARPLLRPQAPPYQRTRAWVQRGGPGRGRLFEDPAVMTTVKGKPSLKSLDSAIVDCAVSAPWDDLDPDARMLPSQGKTKRTSASILQDNAIVCVIDGHGPSGGVALDSPYPYSITRGSRGILRGPYPTRGLAQINPMIPGSPLLTRRPFTPQQLYNQTGGFLSPGLRPCSASPQPRPLTPKMMLRFGANSPRPSPVYSPLANPVQRFRFHGPVTQLHPQHRRLLSQRQLSTQRKPEPWDPYCDLMSAKEKEWIIRLQMIQLQSENPHLDDYYYQEFYRRLDAKLAEEELGVRGHREPLKLTTPYVTKTDTYTPVVHIEGSLGQVAVSTCFSPRRAINAVQAHCPHEEQKDTRQQRLDVLNQIEKLFMVLLEVEAADRVKVTVTGEGEERLVEMTKRKVQHIYTQLQHPPLPPSEAGEEFLPCLLVSKGKKLLARLLPFLSHDAARHVLHVVTSHLHVLMSRDTEEALPVLYPSLRPVIGGLSFSQLIGLLKDLTTSSSDTKDSECLSLACQNKFGLSLLYALLSQGERLLSSDVPLEPSIGDFETWTDIVFQVAWQLSQSSLVEPLLLPSNLLTLFCRYLDKRTVHQLRSNMESATGYLALPS